jgi:hypothetical protein
VPATVVIDEVILTFRVPKGLPDPEADAVRQALASPKFMKGLRSVVRSLVRKQPGLKPVSVALAR